jgi:preprotein translocase subunit Sec61beta
MALQTPRKASFADVAKAVFWSFFGVRKKKDYESDSVSISPLQVVVAGILGAVVFVLTLILVVKLVTSQLAA